MGRKNYRHFVALLSSACLLTSVLVAACIYAGVRQLQDDRSQETSRVHPEVYPGLSVLAYGLLLLGMAIPVIPVWLLIFQLLTFHMGLMHRGMTTYEFIVAQRQKEKERVHEETCLQQWISQNAPCLAVCDLCEEVPSRPTAAQGQQGSTATPAPVAPGAPAATAAAPAATAAAAAATSSTRTTPTGGAVRAPSARWQRWTMGRRRGVPAASERSKVSGFLEGLDLERMVLDLLSHAPRNCT